MGFEREFDAAFSTCNIGYEKHQSDFFTTVLSELNLTPKQVMFFDDSQKNVDAALQLGIHAYLYEGLESLKPALAVIENSLHHEK